VCSPAAAEQSRLNELQATRGRVAKLEAERGQLLSEMEGMGISMKAMRLAQDKVSASPCS
jgi:hypothetical protein